MMSLTSLLKQISFTAIVVITFALSTGVETVLAVDPLIPRSVLFADEDKLNLRLSPDGQSISYLAPVDDTLGVWICSVADPGKPRLLFKQTDVPVMNLQWTYTSRELVYLQPVGEDVHLFVFNLADGRSRNTAFQWLVHATLIKDASLTSLVKTPIRCDVEFNVSAVQ